MNEKFKYFIEKFNNYFSLPVVASILLAAASVQIKNPLINFVMNLIITIFVVFYIFIVVALIFNKTIKDKFMIYFCIVAAVMLLLSFIFSHINAHNESNTLFVLAIILLEVYFIGIIIRNCFKGSKNITQTVIFSVFFIVLGFITIYLSSYELQDKILFNALITIFSALIGGALTLAGVAWTIKNNNDEKRKEEILKAKPYFTFNMLFQRPSDITKTKSCFPIKLEDEYDFDVYGEIENSNHSVVILKRICHDNEWFDLECNNTLIHESKLLLCFRFSDPKDIVLEVSDTLGNLYYYKLSVFHVGLLNGDINEIHTINKIEEIAFKHTK